MDSGSKNLTFSLKNGENYQKHTWGRFLAPKVEKCRIKCYWGFIYDLSRVCPAMSALPLLQRHHPGGRNSTSVACMEPVRKFKNFKPHFHSKPSSHDTQKIPVHAKISFGSSILPNSIPWITLDCMTWKYNFVCHGGVLMDRIAMFWHK